MSVSQIRSTQKHEHAALRLLLSSDFQAAPRASEATLEQTFVPYRRLFSSVGEYKCIFSSPSLNMAELCSKGVETIYVLPSSA